MRKLRIVGDGQRDAVTIPAILRGLLKAEFAAHASPWPRLHRGEKKAPGVHLKGYGLKLWYLLREARTDGHDGVVAAVDADKDRAREKLTQLKRARDADRAQRAPLPTALGEACPHNEAWLLDDPVAVREALGLATDALIPNVRDCPYPKTALEELHRQSSHASNAPLDVWADIAARVDEHRCRHKTETGFEAFAREVRAELGPLFVAVS
jgi:hypothetical protein